MGVESESESEVAQSCPTLCDPMDCIVYQASPSMEFSRQEYWSGLPLWAWHKTQDIPVSNLVFPHGITMAFCIFLEWEGTIQEQSVSGLTADRLSLNCFDDVILLSLQLIFFFLMSMRKIGKKLSLASEFLTPSHCRE